MPVLRPRRPLVSYMRSARFRAAVGHTRLESVALGGWPRTFRTVSLCFLHILSRPADNLLEFGL